MNHYFQKKERFAHLQDSYFHMFEPGRFTIRNSVSTYDDTYDEAMWITKDLAPILPCAKKLSKPNDYPEFRIFQLRYLSNLLEMDMLNFTSRQKANSIAIFLRFFDFATEVNSNPESKVGVVDPATITRTNYHILQIFPEDQQPSNAPIDAIIQDVYRDLLIRLSMDMRIFLVIATQTYFSKLNQPDAPVSKENMVHDSLNALQTLEEIFTAKYITLEEQDDSKSVRDIDSKTHQDSDSNSTLILFTFDPDNDLPMPVFRERTDDDTDDNSAVDLGLEKTEFNRLRGKILADQANVSKIKSLDYQDNTSELDKFLKTLEPSKQEIASQIIDDRPDYQYEYLPEIPDYQLKYELFFKLRYYMAHFDRITYFNEEQFFVFKRFLTLIFGEDIAINTDEYENFDMKNFNGVQERYRYPEFVHYEFGNILFDVGLRKRRELGLLKDSEGVRVRAIQAPAEVNHHAMNTML